jgi:hypothetical protein
MSLLTSCAPTSRATVAYFLAIFILLGGLASLHNYGDLVATSDAQQSKVASGRSIAQDNAEFRWDMVRIRADSLNCTSTVDPTIASACKRT